MDRNRKLEYLKISELISKKITSMLSNDESKKLENWLSKSEENKRIYDKIVSENWYEITEKEVSMFVSDNAWNQLEKKFSDPKKKTSNIRKLFVRYSVAASFAIILILGYLIKFESNQSWFKGSNPIVATHVEPDEHDITLTLPNDENILIQNLDKLNLNFATIRDEEISYFNSQIKSERIKYHYLTVPRGKDYKLILSDSTEVWLNSETQIKYPTHFDKNDSRSIELVYGEAYFKVTPSYRNNHTNFIVSTLNQEVEVLGTEFNIKAIKNTSVIYTTLLEGIVETSTAQNSIILKPNQQLINSNQAFNVVNVDAKTETDWKRGLFSFKDKTLEEITQALERWYHVKFLFENQGLKQILFTGKLSKKQSISDILTIFKDNKFINNFQIKNNNIILK